MKEGEYTDADFNMRRPFYEKTVRVREKSQERDPSDHQGTADDGSGDRPS